MSTIFLTGATGTIGSALVPKLLADPGVQVVMLVRAPDDAAVASRMQAMHAYWQWSADDMPQPGRLRVLRGDISLPRLGLAELEFDRLAAEASHVIHCAASVNLNMSLERARAATVTPTRTILELGRKAHSHGNLRKIDLVSTVGVWGRTPGCMPERRLPEVGDFHNTYEAAKAESERVVWSEAEGLPLTLHRPSMVVGERGDGRVIHFQVFYHLCEFLSGARTFGVMPPLGSKALDTVPVDWVADVIAWSSRSPEATGRILHLCSGPQGSIALAELQGRVRQLWQANGKSLPPLRPVPRRLLQGLVPVIGALVGDKPRRALRALPPVLAYLAEEQSFSNAESSVLFSAAGLPVPSVRDYLDAVLGHYLRKRSDAAVPGSRD